MFSSVHRSLGIPILLNRVMYVKRRGAQYEQTFSGGTVTWSSVNLQSHRILHNEVENQALSEEPREVFFRRLLKELQFIPELKATLNCQSQEVTEFYGLK